MGLVRWFRLSIGLLLVVGPLWVLFSRLDAIWRGHPAYPATLLVTAAVGLALVAVAWQPWRRAPEQVRVPDTPREPDVSVGPRRRTGGWRIAGRVVIGILAVLLVGGLGSLRPFTAGPDALAAVRSDAAVRVVDNSTTIEFVPAILAAPTVGLVFSPGARVDARAYATLLRPVAEAGYLVVILKQPFGLAITQIGQPAGPIADHPEITRWAVGGHSLGGVGAAWFAADNPGEVDGLLLWASFPNDDMSADGTLQVESLSGSNDLLATPADIEKSRANLPPSSTFTVIDGGVHAFFGDYGAQPGDGQPTVDRATASAQIVGATTQFLRRLGAAAPAG